MSALRRLFRVCACHKRDPAELTVHVCEVVVVKRLNLGYN